MTDETAFLALIAAALAVTFLILWTLRTRTTRPDDVAQSWILVDGSNVMHWQDNAPSLEPVKAVVRQLVEGGHVPKVIFDANAGWKLFGRYLHDHDLAYLLGLKSLQVQVVPKGTQADPFLLKSARELGAQIVTNDRFRDWAEAHPEVLAPGCLVRGSYRDGGVRLDGIALLHEA